MQVWWVGAVVQEERVRQGGGVQVCCNIDAAAAWRQRQRSAGASGGGWWRQPVTHLPVEATRAQQCRVQDVGPVGGGDDDDAGVALKAIHLSQQLVQGLLTLIVATANTCSAAVGCVHVR
jgi:hypothetical protein